VIEEAGGPTRLSAELIEREILSDAEVAYDEREAAIGTEAMRQLERRVTLAVLDRKWREHLYEMDYLKEGIGLRAMAQRDPLVEYQREGFQLFQAMTDSIKEETVAYLYNLEVQVAPVEVHLSDGEGDVAAAVAEPAAAAPATPVAPRLVAKGLDGPDRRVPLHYSAPSEDGGGAVVDDDGARPAAAGAKAAPAGRSGAAPAAAAGGANREARRKAAKQTKKRR